MSTSHLLNKFSVSPAMSWSEGVFQVILLGSVAYLADQALWGLDEPRLLGVATTLSGLSGTLLGFLVAALSVLVAVSDKPLIRNMRKTGHFTVLLKNLFGAAVAFLLTLIFAGASLFLELPLLHFATIITTVLLVNALYFFVIAGRRFYKVMMFVSD